MILTVALLVFVAQDLPEGAGKAETEKLCKSCHEMARSISKKQDRDGWLSTMTKMTGFGMKATDAEIIAVVEYLTKNYAADELQKVNVNTATAIQLESGLNLKRSQASALIAYRKENGKFKTLEDLKKVPQLDAAKLEEKKDRIAF
jgi:competence protein ComEA